MTWRLEKNMHEHERPGTLDYDVEARKKHTGTRAT